MSTDPVTAFPDPALPPVPSTLLCSVLGQLGHECVGPCPAADPDLGEVRFAWRNPRRPSSFLVVDLDPQVAAGPALLLLEQVNHCTGKDEIRVLGRRRTDGWQDLPSLSPWTVLS